MRGFNLPINAKLPDFMPLKSATELSYLKALPLYGTSIARVLFTWEAFEPERGQYNMEYLDYYNALIQAWPLCWHMFARSAGRLERLGIGMLSSSIGCNDRRSVVAAAH
jgi:hypothetical protein